MSFQDSGLMLVLESQRMGWALSDPVYQELFLNLRRSLGESLNMQGDLSICRSHFALLVSSVCSQSCRQCTAKLIQDGMTPSVSSGIRPHRLWVFEDSAFSFMGQCPSWNLSSVKARKLETQRSECLQSCHLCTCLGYAEEASARKWCSLRNCRKRVSGMVMSVERC